MTKLNKVLVDGGSGLNILFAKTLDDMKISRSELKQSRAPFHGVIPGTSATPLGGMVNRPLPRRLFLITPPSESKTPLTCLRESPVSLEMVVRTSDFVGAPPFFAILRYSSRICRCETRRRTAARENRRGK